MDVLSDVLRVVRLSGAVFFTADFSSPWAIESPDSRTCLPSTVMTDAECVVLFHILVDGECEVECQGHPQTRMASGDVIVFPRGDQHTMRSHGAGQPTPLATIFFARQGRRAAAAFVRRRWANVTFRVWLLELRSAVQSAGRGRCRRCWWCGAAMTTRRSKRWTLTGSRPTVVPEGSSTWLGTTLKFTVNEARAARPGNVAMLGRLTELMFVEILREYMQRLPTDQSGWFAAVNDPHVGKALRLLHANPFVTGPSTSWRARWDCHARCWRNGSWIWWARRRCATWPTGGCSWRSK
jgi:hypothetical protein